MKKSLMFLLCALLLSGCSGADSQAAIDVSEVISPSGSADLPGCLMEIPQIVNSETPAAKAINDDIQALVLNLQNTYQEDEVMWCEMTAWPTETDRYLNLTVLLQEYPSYGTNGELLSWVYDKENAKQLLLADALSMEKTDEAAIAADIGTWCAENGYIMNGEDLPFLVFRMTADGDVQFLTGASVIAERLQGEVDPWCSFFTWENGEVTFTEMVPFDPAEITGVYSKPLFWQTLESMEQNGDGTAMVSEAGAMQVFESVYEISKYFDDGYTMRFDGEVVEINGAFCLCAVMETSAGEVAGYYAASWDSAYMQDPETGEWMPVAFG